MNLLSHSQQLTVRSLLTLIFSHQTNLQQEDP